MPRIGPALSPSQAWPKWSMTGAFFQAGSSALPSSVIGESAQRHSTNPTAGGAASASGVCDHRPRPATMAVKAANDINTRATLRRIMGSDLRGAWGVFRFDPMITDCPGLRNRIVWSGDPLPQNFISLREPAHAPLRSVARRLAPFVQPVSCPDPGESADEIRSQGDRRVCGRTGEGQGLRRSLGRHHARRPDCLRQGLWQTVDREKSPRGSGDQFRSWVDHEAVHLRLRVSPGRGGQALRG